MSTIRAYIDLMKLRVVELLVITTVPAVVLAEGGFPSLSLLGWTLLGGTLAAGSANAFNMVIESERDKLMKRTAKRPLVTGAVTRVQETFLPSPLDYFRSQSFISSQHHLRLFLLQLRLRITFLSTQSL